MGVHVSRSGAWSEPLAPAAATQDRRGRLRATGTHLEADGTPILPVSGELHYSRVPRDQWDRRLRLMRAGGVTVVSTYVIWIHHEPIEGSVSFDDDLDLAAFVDTAEAAGLSVVLRIGPWVHGEVRNGGFPDWLQHRDMEHRTNDQRYLDQVKTWFERIGEHLDGRSRPGGPVVAVQIENELYDQPEHIATLIELARTGGIDAAIHTATAWGSAQLPETVIPLFGGYGDGFWVDPDAPWDSSFRAHYFFGHVWDDPGIGADLRAETLVDGSGRPRQGPAATCELGGGMATAYHRRPVLSGRDIAAIANTKIGNGSVWQGYYMFAGGSNVSRGHGQQESIETGYPNDMPVFDYDFHAPIDAAGLRNPAFDLLREQHAFLAAFGERLAPMPAAMPSNPPTGLDDTDSLRWALRSDGRSGFVVIGQHQPYESVAEVRDVSFAISLTGREVRFPEVPITIPSGTLARWPLALTLPGAPELRWATATALTILEGEAGPVLVLRADEGITPQFAVGSGATVTAMQGAVERLDDSWRVDVGGHASLRVESPAGVLEILILDSATARETWVLEPLAADYRRKLLRSTSDLWLDEHGAVAARAVGDEPASVEVWEPKTRTWRHGADAPRVGRVARGAIEQVREATELRPPAPSSGGRHRAPAHDSVVEDGAAWVITAPPWIAEEDATATIEWRGDVAVLEVDGRIIADRFWDGTPWRISADLLRGAARIVLRALPMHPNSTVGLADEAASIRDIASRAFVAVDSVTFAEHVEWTAVER